MLKHPTTTDESKTASALAYKFWVARCVRDGSPEEDLFGVVYANSMKSGATKRGRIPTSRLQSAEDEADVLKLTYLFRS